MSKVGEVKERSDVASDHRVNQAGQTLFFSQKLFQENSLLSFACTSLYLRTITLSFQKNLLWKNDWGTNLKCPCESVGLTGVSFSDNKRHTPSRMWPSESQVDRHSGLEGQNFSLFTHHSGPSRLLIKWFCHSVKRTIAIWVEWVS